MEAKNTIQRIEEKISSLGGYLNRLKEENAILKQEINDLNDQLKAKNTSIHQLENDIRRLEDEAEERSEAAGQVHSDDAVSFQQAIDQYIDEIDRCIEWLQNN